MSLFTVIKISSDVNNNNYNGNKRYDDDDGNNNMVKGTYVFSDIFFSWYASLLSLHPSLSHSLDCTFFCWA